MRGAISQSCEETSEEVFSPKFFEKVSVRNSIFIPTTYEEYFSNIKKEVAHEQEKVQCTDAGRQFLSGTQRDSSAGISCNGSRIDTVCLRFSEAEAFAIKVGVQWIDDVGG